MLTLLGWLIVSVLSLVGMLLAAVQVATTVHEVEIEREANTQERIEDAWRGTAL